MFQKLAFLKVIFQKKCLLNQAAYARPLTRSTENLYAEENEKTFLIEASFHYRCKSRVYSCNLIKKGLHYKGTPHGFCNMALFKSLEYFLRDIFAIHFLRKLQDFNLQAENDVFEKIY